MSNSAKIILKKNTILAQGNFLGNGSGVNGTGSISYSNNDNLNQIVLVRKVIDSNSNEKHLVGISQYNISHNISKYNNKIYFHKKRNDVKIDLNVKNSNINYINDVPYLLDNSINFTNSDGNTENFTKHFKIVLNFKISNFSTLFSNTNTKSDIYINFDLVNMLKSLYKNENNIQELKLNDVNNNNSNYHLIKKNTKFSYLLDFIRPNSPTINTIVSSDNSSKNYNIYFTYIYKET